MNSNLTIFVLTADKQTKYAVRGLLNRPKDLGCRPLEFKLEVHPRKDAGCFREAHTYLRGFLKTYSRALVVFDNEFDRARKLLDLGRVELQDEVTLNLSRKRMAE